MFTGYCDIRAFPRRMSRSNRVYYDRVSSISRIAVGEMEEIIIEFEAGGKVHILTERPILWVNPEVH